MMEQHWDRSVADELRKHGLTQDQIGTVIGIVADHRMSEDHEGFKRGFDCGFAEARSRGVRKFSPGDRVRCIDPNSDILPGVEYTVIENLEHCLIRIDTPFFDGKSETVDTYFEWRFELVQAEVHSTVKGE